MPNKLDRSRLSQFSPKPSRKQDSDTSKAVNTGGEGVKPVTEKKAWPSREAPKDGMLGLRGSQETLDEFKALCKSERRTYVDMLRVLMDGFSQT